MTAAEPADVARLRAAFAALALDAPGDHVDAGRVFDALHGHASQDERHAVVDEMLANPAAAEAWRLARDLTSDTAESPAPRALWTWMSIAAALALTVGAGWMVVSSRQAAEPAYRSVEAPAAISASSATRLSRSHPVLRWEGPSDARYRVRVFTADLDMLEESPETTAREFRVGPDALERIPPGTRLLWQIEARVPGEGVVVSPTFSIQVP